MENAHIEITNGDGSGTLRAHVVRDSDRATLGTIRYNPESNASVEALDVYIADICGKYGVEIATPW